MDLRRNLRDINPGATYNDPSRRMFWPSFHFSLAVPSGCSISAGEKDGLFKNGDGTLAGCFTLHDATSWLVSNWMDEGFTHNDEKLAPVEPTRTELSVVSRRFASKSFVGCKVRSDDVFRNGASTLFSGPSAQADALSKLVKQFVQSIRFLHLQPLPDEQIIKAIVPYLNVQAPITFELMQYIDLHFYLLRDEVMSTIGTLSSQAVKEQNPEAARVIWRRQVLQEARYLVDRSAWDKTIAAIRAANLSG